MRKDAAFVLLWLEGPFQAWGENSKFGLRSTWEFPTKSGILGMTLAAMGKGGEQTPLLQELVEYTHETFRIDHCISSSEMMDYHVIGNGYENLGWEKLLIPRKRDGTIPVGGGAKLTYRYYLQDAIFAVIMGIPKELASEIKSAFINPVWPLSLGRRNCIPTRPIFNGVFDTFDLAKDRLDAMIAEREFKISAIQHDYSDPKKGEVVLLSDVPVCFGEHKKYKSRYVTIEYV